MYFVQICNFINWLHGITTICYKRRWQVMLAAVHIYVYISGHKLLSFDWIMNDHLGVVLDSDITSSWLMPGPGVFVPNVNKVASLCQECDVFVCWAVGCDRAVKRGNPGVWGSALALSGNNCVWVAPGGTLPLILMFEAYLVSLV